MTREQEILGWITTGIRRFGAELHGYKIVLFGSRAHGHPKSRSDFDIGIIGKHPVTLSTFFKIDSFLNELPTLYKIDWVDLNRADEAVRNNALKDVKVLYEQT